jgi:DNA primase
MADSYDRDAWSKRANEIRARIPVSTVVGRVVELKKRGNEHTGLCPFHNERTPSFTVNDKKGFFHCFGCGQHGDALAFVMQRQGLEFQAAVQLLESESGLRHLQQARPAPPPPKVRQAEDVKKAEAVARIWRETVPLDRGGVVDRYLRGRCMVPPADYGFSFGDTAANGGWPPDLRFCAELWHGEEKRRMPGMVTGMRRGGAVVAVHRTYLKVTGVGVTKAGTSRDKVMFGDVAGSMILLGPVSDKMIGGEGIETSLSAMQLYRRSGLAFGARAGMATVEPPFECSDFIYAADKNKVHPDPEKSRVGERAAWKGARAFGVGRVVQVKIPNLVAETGDFNDMLQIVARGGPSPVSPAGDRRAAPLPPATPSAKVPA